MEKLLAMGQEQETGARLAGLAEAAVVEGRDHRLAGAGGGHHQVAPMPTGPRRIKGIEDAHLEIVGPQVVLAYRHLGLAAGSVEAVGQVGAIVGVVGIEAPELAVLPQPVEGGREGVQQVGGVMLGRLERPFQAAAQGGDTDIRRADIDGAETGGAVEAPCLGVQPRPPGVVADLQGCGREAGQRLQRLGIRGAHVGRTQHADASAAGRQIEKGIAQLPEAVPLDETDDEIDLVAGGEFGGQLLAQGRFSGTAGQQGRTAQRGLWPRWHRAGRGPDPLQPLAGLGHRRLARERFGAQGVDAGHEIVGRGQLPGPAVIGRQGAQCPGQVPAHVIRQSQRQIGVIDRAPLGHQAGLIGRQATGKDPVDQRLVESRFRAGRHASILPVLFA
ncbi:MAG: hypothetical protein RLZZ127_227 [Planctomycetota bacterium]